MPLPGPHYLLRSGRLYAAIWRGKPFCRLDIEAALRRPMAGQTRRYGIFSRGITNTLKFFPDGPIKGAASEPASAAIDPPKAVLSPWRQVRRYLRPDEQPCRQGTLL